jgi:hypothetical protein
MHVYEHIVQMGFKFDAFVGNNLVDIYMQNLGTWMSMLIECLIRCHLEMWLVGLP